MLGLRILGRCHLHHFHFEKLVLAHQAAHVLAVGPDTCRRGSRYDTSQRKRRKRKREREHSKQSYNPTHEKRSFESFAIACVVCPFQPFLLSLPQKVRYVLVCVGGGLKIMHACASMHAPPLAHLPGFCPKAWSAAHEFEWQIANVQNGASKQVRQGHFSGWDEERVLAVHLVVHLLTKKENERKEVVRQRKDSK